ncbi:hypothetical protein HG535_0E01580 [Zygotorulaspora mrakii]|uniref:Uncharacterized protein n=1 Tax=Zygotorulaspora mrakii TaxID=42260 RepID=A0A7H9B3U0_ZYGMR|nr:uncharacterized protein HG535_0E01580 [Zygotorulaspora mrakii]QLG73074.1 hypothetical protein HG535_0E01580 [Zygotorulaspora mrakii]
MALHNYIYLRHKDHDPSCHKLIARDHDPRPLISTSANQSQQSIPTEQMAAAKANQSAKAAAELDK